ncbi:MAG: hypothetical protein E6R02_05570 [Gammaproteobacteria bacterium]|nr:MAG: hypothetical protein E6R02_05570 [Gammaproteobacteria bacterium]
MDQVQRLRTEIEQLIGISNSDSEMFWALSKKCATLALAPTVAAGAKWGPGLVSLGTVALPGLGTVSGTTAALLMMGGVWGSNYGLCMSILPGLMQFRDRLRSDQAALIRARHEVRFLITANRSSSRA